MDQRYRELLQGELSGDFEADIRRFRALFRSDVNSDAQFRRFMAGDTPICAAYIEGMADAERISAFVLHACAVDRLPESRPLTSGQLAQSVMEIAQCLPERRVDRIVDAMVTGMTAVFVSGGCEALLLETRGYPARQVEKPTNESVVAGAQEGFVESLRTNMTLLRRYLPSPRLITETCTVGDGIPCQVCLAYLDGVAQGEVIDAMRTRLEAIHVPSVTGIGELQQLIEDAPFALLPQMLQTERPDRAASCLLDGQVVLLADNSPCALAAPITLYHQLHASDDSFSRWQYGTFLRLVRMAGIMISVFLPGLYIALTHYHMHLIPMSLLTSIAEARANVPFPILAEILMMEFAFCLINEAGTRMPRQIGSALGIVGALILGQAAVAASIISPILIIIVALTGLGSYAVPDYGFSLGLVLYRLFVILCGALLGLYGICLAAYTAACGICAMKSLGFPYTAPLAPPMPHNPDILLRLPAWLQRRRMLFARHPNWLEEARH